MLKSKTNPFILIMLLINLVYFTSAPNVFQKGGVSSNHYYIICVLIFSNTLVYSFSDAKRRIVARVFQVTLISSLSCGLSIMLTHVYVKQILADKTWLLWGNPDRLLANMLLFLSSSLCVFLFSELVKRVRKKHEHHHSRTWAKRSN